MIIVTIYIVIGVVFASLCWNNIIWSDIMDDDTISVMIDIFIWFVFASTWPVMFIAAILFGLLWIPTKVFMYGIRKFTSS